MSTITREFAPADRYIYDFKFCNFKNGWAQLDTRQDASYYGNWINPITLKLFSYCEGDTTLTECTDAADFVREVRECVEWHRNSGYYIGIDGMCSEPIIEAFTRMGLAEFLH
jgi:hypothetical protein